MTTVLLLVSIFAASILAWLFRQRLAKHLPSKETMSTFALFAPIVLLLIFAFLPDIVVLLSTMNLMPASVRIVLALAAAVVVCVGCSKQADKPQPHQIHWRAPETGYHADSPPDNKEGP